jgi:hypothetical protein
MVPAILTRTSFIFTLLPYEHTSQCRQTRTKRSSDRLQPARSCLLRRKARSRQDQCDRVLGDRLWNIRRDSDDSYAESFCRNVIDVVISGATQRDESCPSASIRLERIRRSVLLLELAVRWACECPPSSYFQDGEGVAFGWPSTRPTSETQRHKVRIFKARKPGPDLLSSREVTALPIRNRAVIQRDLLQIGASTSFAYT